MRLRRAVPALLFLLLFAGVLAAFQRPFRVFRALEGYDDLPLPADYQKPAELVLGRLMYPSAGGARGGGGNWLQGGTNWTVDYPKGDRFFDAALRRLTLLDVRSVEQPVNPDDGDDIFYWPYLHVAMPGSWRLTEAQGRKLAEYFNRGGFLLCDSFFGTAEWGSCEVGLKLIFPDREVVDLDASGKVFHTVHNIRELYQVANWRSLRGTGRTYRGDGDTPHFRAILDDKGRVMIAMAFNNDLGDSWQLADVPEYPEKYSALGLRLGVNYVVYAMSH
jgi:hypothetical protein